MGVNPPQTSSAWREPRFLHWLAQFELILAVTFLFTMAAGVLWQVLGRYLPALAWAGAGEVARFSLVGITFVTVGYLIGQNGQITVAVIDRLVKGRGRALVRGTSATLLTLICLVLTWEAWHLFSGGFGRNTPVTGVPLGYLYMVPLAGFVSGTIHSVFRILRTPYDDPDSIVPPDSEA